jgi:hypothetical protein
MKAEREMLVTAMVTVSIPVGLAFDGPVSWDEMREAALQTFLNHPAIEARIDMGQQIEDLKGFVDRIEVTHD